jgi:hypothetical protein
MNKSTTPRTDAETCIWSGRKIFVNKSLALKLELELAVSLENQVKAQVEIEQLRKENNEFLLSEAALSEELKICDGWLVHTRNENARLRNQRDGLIEIAKWFEERYEDPIASVKERKEEKKIISKLAALKAEIK